MNAASIKLHPFFQYGPGVATNLLKSRGAAFRTEDRPTPFRPLRNAPFPPLLFIVL